MGRLKPEMLDRVDEFSDRVLDVVEVLEKQGRPRRVIEQLAGCGTSVGANLCEADEAMSRPDFVKTLCIVIKELNETRYWLRLIGRRDWIKQTRLLPLQQEADELKRICGAIVSRTRLKAKTKTPTSA